MRSITQLEDMVLKWLKGVPHLPDGGRKWLADNVWWIALTVAIICALAVLFDFFNLMGAIALTGVIAPGASYYVVRTITGVMIFSSIVSIVFFAAQAIILGIAVMPLKERQKKGWVLLFMSVLLEAAAIVITAVLSLNIVTFITTIIFGGVLTAALMYLVFEIHGKFAHVQKSKGITGKKDVEGK